MKPKILLMMMMTMFVVVYPQKQAVTNLEGTVTDSHGSVIPDAQIQIVSGESFTQTVQTDLNGRYTLEVPPNSLYNLLATKYGFCPYERKSIQPSAGAAITVNFVLIVCSIDTVITTGGSPEPGSVNTVYGLPYTEWEMKRDGDPSVFIQFGNVKTVSARSIFTGIEIAGADAKLVRLSYGNIQVYASSLILEADKTFTAARAKIEDGRTTRELSNVEFKLENGNILVLL